MYTRLNVDAAVSEDRRWYVGTNAIEYSSIDGNGTGTLFLKFFTFAPSGGRRLTTNMDGLGEKALPAVCAACHGGRADPLTPPGGALNLPLFPSVANSESGKRGDITAHFQPLAVDSFEYSDLVTTRAWTRDTQEPALKRVNEIVAQTYPTAIAIPGTGPYVNEWQGAATSFVNSAYGGAGHPSAQFVEPGPPAGWVGHEELYNKVVAPYCRACHLVRGTRNQSDIDFTTFTKFDGYSKRIRALVYDRGNMPLSKVTYDAFWASDAPSVLATYLEGKGETGMRDGSGNLLRPGRPVAIPGPERTTISPAPLSAANSLNATTYQWSIVSGPAGATLSNATSVAATLTAPTLGDYIVQLVVGNGSTQSAPVNLTVHIVAGLTLADGSSLGKTPDQNPLQ